MKHLLDLGQEMAESMRAHTRHIEAFRVLMRPRRSGVPARVLIGLTALVLLFVQAIHPRMHPVEVIDFHTDAHVICPISHAAADLPPELPALLLRPLVLAAVLDPPLWWGHSGFSHTLAPRPPPALHP
jgi:hypothetical protein